MLDSWLPSAWPAAVVDAMSRFRQGHLVQWDSLAFAANFSHAICNVTAQTGTSGSGYVRVDKACTYGLITSQTCDICEEGKKIPRIPWVTVVPVYNVLPFLSNGQDGLVRKNRIGYLLPLTHENFINSEALWVADLRIEYPLEKGILVDQKPIEAFASEKDYAYFANSLAFRRNRPALDGRVIKLIITPLRDALTSNSIQSDNIEEVRIRCGPTWNQVERAQLFFLIRNATLLEETLQAIEIWQAQLIQALPADLALLHANVISYETFTYLNALNTTLVDFAELSV